IKWYENIPLISWLILRGRCSDCKAAIGLRYPIVELVTALLSMLVIYQFGVSAAGLSALILVWTLVALTGIDFDTQLLPDRLSFSGLRIGGKFARLVCLTYAVNLGTFTWLFIFVGRGKNLLFHYEKTRHGTRRF